MYNILSFHTTELSGLEVAHTVVTGLAASLRELRTGVTLTPDRSGCFFPEPPNTPLLRMMADSIATTHSSFSSKVVAIKTARLIPDMECCSTENER